jgi:type I restriction-modification system DNA methylase subunit
MRLHFLAFVRSVISLERSALSAKNLIRDFCGDSYDGIVFRVARELSDVLAYKATIKTEMLRTEWEALFRLAHEDQSQQKRIEERRRVLGEIFGITITEATMEYRALFSLHTAYAIILKLIAFRVVFDVKFDTVLQDYKSLTSASSDVIRTFCATLEDGELFRQIGILNLLEGDFFSWYADSKQWNTTIAHSVKDIIVTLPRYEDIKAIFDRNKAVDLFRSLYEATVPQNVRASFGEFYTPYWLAEHVLDNSRLTKTWTALDPCCGSGTFLIAAIALIRREMKDKPPSDVVSAILDRVFGIDLNPLAILTARIHYFIHIADLLTDWETTTKRRQHLPSTSALLEEDIW